MTLELYRMAPRPACTTGKLSADGVFFCYTMEPSIKPAGSAKPYAIPAGTYQVVVRFSPKRGYNVPGLEAVPGFSDIEMHVGNHPQDTDGCILVGEYLLPGQDFLTNSTTTFKSLMSLVESYCESGELEITIFDYHIPSP